MIPVTKAADDDGWNEDDGLIFMPIFPSSGLQLLYRIVLCVCDVLLCIKNDLEELVGVLFVLR